MTCLFSPWNTANRYVVFLSITKCCHLILTVHKLANIFVHNLRILPLMYFTNLRFTGDDCFLFKTRQSASPPIKITYKYLAAGPADQVSQMSCQLCFLFCSTPPKTKPRWYKSTPLFYSNEGIINWQNLQLVPDLSFSALCPPKMLDSTPRIPIRILRGVSLHIRRILS